MVKLSKSIPIEKMNSPAKTFIPTENGANMVVPENAVKGYREINLRALKLVKDGGFLATCSCSHFMTYELFTKTIAQAARSAHRRLRQVEYRTQAPDHPILWAADESYYLKFYIFQVCIDK